MLVLILGFPANELINFECNVRTYRVVFGSIKQFIFFEVVIMQLKVQIHLELCIAMLHCWLKSILLPLSQLQAFRIW